MLSIKTADRERMAQLCHALSDETRLQLLELLAEGEQCVCDLTDALKSSQSRLSFHLKTLKEAGLLQDRREGRWVYYSLEPAALEELKELLQSVKARSRTAIQATQRCD